MPFVAESDDLRLEVRDGTTPTIYRYAKTEGENVRVTGTPTYEVKDPAGTVLASGSVTVTLVGDIDRMDLVLPAINTRDENYRIEYTFVATIPGAPEILDVAYFDVVAYPLDTSVSLNDLLEERPDVGEVLDRLGVLLGFTTGDGIGQARPEMAAVFSRRALVELDAKIRDQVYQESARGADYTSTNPDTIARKYTRPNLILNRERLNRPLRKMAMRLIYAADMASVDSGDESASLFAFYDEEALTTWAGIGPLQYDGGQDLVPDETLQSLGKVKTLTRVQG